VKWVGLKAELSVKNLRFSALVGLAGQRRSRVEETRVY
jgi:hypothetical protein